jgi:hypothetical protein
MKKYYLNINSNRIAIISFVVLFPPTLFLLGQLPKGINNFILFLLFFGQQIGITYLITIFSRARIKIEITDKSYKHIWIKKFLFSRESDVEIKWSQIIDYVFEEDRGFDSFQLTLPDKKRYKIWRNNYFTQNADFTKFNTYFPKDLERINDALGIEIKRGKTIYEERGFKWIMLFISIVVGFLICNKLINPGNGINWSTLGILVLAMAFYGLRMRNKSS